MSNLKVFTNPEFGEVRTVMRDGEPWFVAVDVCRALEITNNRDAVSRLDEDEKEVVSTDTPGGEQQMTIINEPGLYSLVLGSRKPEAKAFKRWVTHEVIPAIRKHGIYATDELLENPDIAIAAFTRLKEERAARRLAESVVAQQAQIITELQPKASYYDVVLQTPDLLPISAIAKDYGKSAKWMNQKLHDMGVQYKQGDIWLLYQKHAEQGYTKSKTQPYTDRNGVAHSTLHTYWTQKGRLYIYDRLKSEGILPTMENDDQRTA